MLSPEPCCCGLRCFRVRFSCPRLSWRKTPPLNSPPIKTTRLNSQSIKTTSLKNQSIKTPPRNSQPIKTMRRLRGGKRPWVSENVPPDLGPETVRATADAARRYMEIAARGAWPRLARALHPGAKGGDVARLRRRLGAEGYLGADAAGGSNSKKVSRRLSSASRPIMGSIKRATCHARPSANSIFPPRRAQSNWRLPPSGFPACILTSRKTTSP